MWKSGERNSTDRFSCDIDEYPSEDISLLAEWNYIFEKIETKVDNFSCGMKLIGYIIFSAIGIILTILVLSGAYYYR